MPLELEELTPEQKLFDMIDKVVIVRGAISSDPKIWELNIKGKVLKLDTDRLENMKQFRQQYLKAFNRPAPRIKLTRWSSFLEALADDKATETQDLEESRHVFIARQIFEIGATVKCQTLQKTHSQDWFYTNTFSMTMKKYITVCLQKFS